MIATLESCVDILRVFRDDAIPYVDQYEFSATVIYSDMGKTAYIKGMTSNLRSIVAMRSAIRQAFQEKGVSLVCWDRSTKQGFKRVEVKI